MGTEITKDMAIEVSCFLCKIGYGMPKMAE